jgi:hypothetical protein
VLLKHEVFLLLRSAYKDSGASVRRRLIRAVERAFPIPGLVTEASDQRVRLNLFELFDLLSWLQESDPACPLVAASLAKLRQRTELELSVSEHPDFFSWSSGVQTVRSVSPIPVAQIVALQPAAWVAEFDRLTTSQRDSRENPVHGFLAESEKAAAQDFDWGLRLAEHLAAMRLWDHAAWHPLLRCWAGMALDEAPWQRVIDFLLREQELLRHAAEVADLVSNRMERRDLPATAAMVNQACALADRLWAALRGDTEAAAGGAKDWVQLAINRTGGKLGLFAVHALSRLYGIENESWAGIPGPLRPLLERIAEASNGSSTLGRVILCSQLHFCFSIDRKWTETYLFPLFDWARDHLAAEQAWHGFLVWGRPTRELMAEFMPAVIATFAHLADLGAARPRFSQYLAWIAYGATQDPLDAGWIEGFLRTAEPQDRREWAQTIRSLLSDLEPDERRRLWETWLRRYIAFRTESEIPIGDDEWAEVIHWSLPLSDLLPDFVAVVMKHPAPRGRQTLLYYQISQREPLPPSADPLADFLAYLLDAERRQFHDCEYVRRIVEKLLEAGVAAAKLLPLAERLAELGCEDAQELGRRIAGNDA